MTFTSTTNTITPQPATRSAIKLLALLVAVSLLGACTSSPRAAQRSERQAKAIAMWQERCKTAGEKIHQTVDNVEGVYLMKVRTTTNFGDQFVLDDPYGSDHTKDGYIKSFLRGFYTPVAKPTPYTPPRMAYLYVEAQDPKDGQRYRYTGRIDQPWLRDKAYGEWVRDFVLDKAPAPGKPPRYGVTYDDISTREEREYWIAGSSLKVIDLQTNTVIAERIGYMVDWAQGSDAGGRSPWLLAANQACPEFDGKPGSMAQTNQTEKFVEKVLKPAK